MAGERRVARLRMLRGTPHGWDGVGITRWHLYHRKKRCITSKKASFTRTDTTCMRAGASRIAAAARLENQERLKCRFRMINKGNEEDAQKEEKVRKIRRRGETKNARACPQPAHPFPPAHPAQSPTLLPRACTLPRRSSGCTMRLERVREGAMRARGEERVVSGSAKVWKSRGVREREVDNDAQTASGPCLIYLMARVRVSAGCESTTSLGPVSCDAWKPTPRIATRTSAKLGA
ncbi:hypothetical protein C8J57DRAFT_1245066 [Mycena rebaudengoi]|nr:hypothetical protein C8J57DRAFT_1245066 [Mycena rebaudengoi]